MVVDTMMLTKPIAVAFIKALGPHPGAGCYANRPIEISNIFGVRHEKLILEKW